MCSNKDTPRIMVFRPTWKEFQNFSSYIELMESQGAHKAGVAKVCYYKNIAFFNNKFRFYVTIQPFFSKYVILILQVIPPPEWIPRKKSYFEDDIMNLKIPAPICQVILLSTQLLINVV